MEPGESAGRNQTLAQLQSRALSPWDEKPLPSAGGCFPCVPSAGCPAQGCRCLLAFLLAVGELALGGRGCMEGEGMPPATAACWGQTQHGNQLGQIG